MTVKELIKQLRAFDPSMEVQCSVDCDLLQEHDGRRVFGANCRGVNPHHDLAVLMFDFDEVNFEGTITPTKDPAK